MKFNTQTPEETLVLGENLGKHLIPGDIVLLFGDLGAGKTTFIQGVCRGLGMAKGEYIRSPSFTLINEYQGGNRIYHIDLYRLETHSDIESLGLEEVLFGSGVALVEWAEKLYLPDKNTNSIGFGISDRIEVHIEITCESGRMLNILPIYLKKRDFSIFTLQ